MAKLLIKMLDTALEQNGESQDDLIFISHPIELIEEEPTLDVIQCDYLNSAYGWHIVDSVDKQDMPFAAATKNHIYHLAEYGYSDKVYSFEYGQIENPDWQAMFELSLERHDQTLDDVRGMIYPIGTIQDVEDMEPLEIPPEVLFIAFTDKVWYYCGKDTLYYIQQEPDRVIRDFIRDDIGGSKKWTPEYVNYRSKMSNISIMVIKLWAKCPFDRYDRVEDELKPKRVQFNCFTEHPETRNKVKVSVVAEGAQITEVIDKNGIDLLKIYDHLKVDR